MSEKQRLDMLHKAYCEALAVFQEADRAATSASMRQTDALNSLNRAQKALDAAVEAMKSAAPQSSDWKRKRER